MTDVHCDKKRCLNNCKGWCKAKAIHVDGVCKSYAHPKTLMSGNYAKVSKRSGKYKQNEGIVLK